MGLFLTVLVKPLSAAISRPFDPVVFAEALAANMILFGVPIALRRDGWSGKLKEIYPPSRGG